MRRAGLLLLALALGLAAPAGARAEGGADLIPREVRVLGGETSWHRVNDFRIDWNRVADLADDPPPTTIEYGIRDEGGELVVPVSATPWVGDLIDHIHVPPQPGRYEVEFRLSDDVGSGPWVSAELRFDDTRPQAALPLVPAGWIAAGVRPRLRIEHPPAPLPPSGIRGYAVTVERGPPDSPCAATIWCGDAEVDLGGGIDDDEIVLRDLPEGIHDLRVVAVSGSGMSSVTVGSAMLRVDATVPEVVLRGRPDGWTDGPVRLRATASDRLSGMSASGPAGPFTAIAVDGGLPIRAAGAAVEAVVSGEGVHRISSYGRDAAGNVGDGQLGSPAPQEAVVRIDGTPPRVSFPAARDPSDPERIEAIVADELSGPATGRGSIGVRPLGSGERFVPLPSSVSAGRISARWDSDAYPPGNYEFSATGYDRAGNSTGSDRRSDGRRMVLANPLKATVAIRFGFGGRRMTWHRCRKRGARRRCRRETIESFQRRPRTRTMPYGRRIAVAGKLTRRGGAPLAGRRISLVEALATGTERTTTVLTGADGTFLARLEPGPGRRIEARFAGSRLLTRAAGRRLQLLVPAAVRIGASAATAAVGGAPIRFRGRVGALGAAIPRSGLSVELQFRLPGTPWSEFRTVQTDRRGRFHYAYAFSDDDSRGARFLFRAVVPAQAGWPYAEGRSRPIAITGR